MKKKFAKKLVVAALSASMLLSSTGLSALLASAATNTTTAPKTTVSGSADTANVTKGGGELTTSEPQIVKAGGSIAPQALTPYDAWGAGTGTVTDPYEVDSLADFLGIQTIVNDDSRSDKYFILTANINLSGVTPSTNGDPDYGYFPGVLISASPAAIATSATPANIFFHIDGNGKKLCEYNYSNSSYSTAGIFGYINPASTIENLEFESCTLNSTYASSFNNSIVAVQNAGTISNCVFNNMHLTVSAPSATTDSAALSGHTVYRAASVVVGDNVGTFTGNTVTNARIDVNGNARYVGMAVGQNRGTVSNSTVSGIKIVATATSMYVGALVGSNVGVSSSIDGCTVNFAGSGTAVTNNMAFADIMGGIVGRNAGTVSNSKVIGAYSSVNDVTPSAYNLYSTLNFGGIAGENVGSISSSSAIDVGAYIMSSSATAAFGYGGIAGKNSGTVVRCVASGNVVDSGSESAYMYAGGLVGVATGTITSGISESYSFVALPKSPTEIGALIGRNGTAAMLNKCYYEASISGRTTPYNGFKDAFVGDLSGGHKYVVLSGGSTVNNKSTITPDVSGIDASLTPPTFGFTASTPYFSLEDGSNGINLTQSDTTYTLTSSTAGSVDNVIANVSVTMPANVGSTAGISFVSTYKVPVMYPSASVAADGYIVLSNTTELNFIKYAPFAKYRLGADITASSSWNSFKFMGTIDGDGHSLTVSKPLFSNVIGSKSDALTASNESDWISNAATQSHGYLYDLNVVLSSNLNNTAVFGTIADASMNNVTFKTNGTAVINATQSTVGAMFNEIKGTVYLCDCYTDVSIRINALSQNYFGGIAARVNANDLIIDNCGSSSGILSSYSAGILASFIGSVEKNSSYGIIKNCYATGEVQVSGDHCYIGIGSFSTNQAGQLLNNSWSISNTAQGSREAAAAAQQPYFAMWRFNNDFGMVNQVSFSNFTITIPTLNAFTGLTVADLSISYDNTRIELDTIVISGSTITIPAKMAAGVSIPDSTIVVTHPDTGFKARLNIVSGLTTDLDGYYVIANAADMMFLHSQYPLSKTTSPVDYTDKNFKVTADIDMTGYTFNSLLAYDATNTNPVDFIGKFVGALGANGEKYTISNLSIVTNSSHADSPTGLFSYVSGTVAAPATFENLIFANTTVNGGNYAGVIAGKTNGSVLFKNIEIDTATINGGSGDHVGGLIGGGTSNDITADFNGISVHDTSITTTGGFVGGFAGLLSGKNSTTLNNGDYSICVGTALVAGATISNTIDNLTISAADGAGGVFGVVSSIPDILNVPLEEDNVYNTVFDPNTYMYDYNSISLNMSDIAVSDSSFTVDNGFVGGVLGVSNSTGFDSYGVSNLSTITNCSVSETALTNNVENIARWAEGAAGGIAAVYSGELTDSTVTDCTVDSMWASGIVGALNFNDNSGISVDNCNVLGATVLDANDCTNSYVGGIIAQVSSYAWCSIYTSFTNCNIGQNVSMLGAVCSGGIMSQFVYGLGYDTLIIQNCKMFADLTSSAVVSSIEVEVGGLIGIWTSNSEIDTIDISNNVVGGTYYSANSLGSVGGLVGWYDPVTDYVNTAFLHDCYMGALLNAGQSAIKVGYVFGKATLSTAAQVTSFLANITLSSFKQYNDLVVGSMSTAYNTTIKSTDCVDVNIQPTASANFYSGGYYTLTSSVPTGILTYSFSNANSNNVSYSGISTNDPLNPTDSLILDNTSDAVSGRVNGWYSSSADVTLTQVTAPQYPLSGASPYSHVYSVEVNGNSELGNADVYSRFISSNITIPDSDGEYFYLRVGVSVRSRVINIVLAGGGTALNPYLISNESELSVLSANHQTYTLDKFYKLTNDISIEGTVSPIGTDAQKFTGDFDGDGYTITDVNNTGDYVYTIEESVGTGATSVTGLFGYTDGANIHDLTVSSFRIHTTAMTYYAGIIAAYATNTVFDNITIEDSTVDNAYWCGGVVGHADYTSTPADSSVTLATVRDTTVTAAYNNSIPNSSIAGGIAGEFGGVIGSATLAIGRTEDILVEGCTVTGTASFAGGIVGRDLATGAALTVQNAVVRTSDFNGSTVTAYSSLNTAVSVRRSAGGIVGGVLGANNPATASCTILNSSVGNNVLVRGVSGSGGIVGSSYLASGTLTIDNCESKARVDVIASLGVDKGTGAIIGTANELTVLNIKNSSAGGSVTGRGKTGGIIGSFSGTASVATVTTPIVYNCLVSATLSDQKANTSAGVIIGETDINSDNASYSSRISGVFPSDGAYTVVPFLNVFYSSYQNSATLSSNGRPISNCGAINTLAYVGSIATLVDLNSILYDGTTIVMLPGSPMSASDNFSFNPAGDLVTGSYLAPSPAVNTTQSFSVNSTFNSITTTRTFVLDNIKSSGTNNIIGYNSSSNTIQAVGEGTESMEFVYSNGIVIAIDVIAMSDLNTDALGNYLISRVAHLGVLKIFPNANFKQTADLDFASAEYSVASGNNGTYDAFSAQGGEFYNAGSYWLPVNFSGNYDGNNKTISGLTIHRTGSGENVGFFGTLSGTVKNLTFSGGDIQGNIYTGAVASILAESGRIEGVKVTNNCSISGTKYVGGIVGRVNSETVPSGNDPEVASVYNCEASGLLISTTGLDSAVGGIVGYSAGAFVSNCRMVSSTISSTNASFDQYNNYMSVSGVVGIAGAPSRSTDYDTDIINCSVDGGSISSPGSAAGILCGTTGYYDPDTASSINIVDCSVGSIPGLSTEISNPYSAGGIFTQPLDFYSSYSLSNCVINIEGAYVGKSVSILADEDNTTLNGCAGGIVGYINIGSWFGETTTFDYFVNILESESYAYVMASYSAGAIVGTVYFPQYLDQVSIEASAAGGTVDVLTPGGYGGYAGGFFGMCNTYGSVYTKPIVRDCIFSATFVAPSGYYGIVAGDATGTVGDGIVSSNDLLYQNIYYSSYQQTDLTAFSLNGFASNETATLTDIAVDSDGNPVIMIDNTGDDSFSSIAFAKYSGTDIPVKRFIKLNITGKDSDMDDRANVTDIGLKATPFNLANTVGVSFPITMTGISTPSDDVDVVWNDIPSDARYSATLTAHDEVLSSLVVELSGGLEVSVSLITANLDGSGTALDPFLVASANNLNTVSKASGGFYWKQTANITLPENFVPIGNTISPFTGGYDGDGYKIIDVTLNLNQSDVGVFGYVNGNAELKNIHIELSSAGITGIDYVGGLVGRYEGINSIVNCSVAYGKVVGTNYVGGLAGGLNGGLRQCFTSTDIIATGTGQQGRAGGLIGEAMYLDTRNAVTIESSFSSGSVCSNNTFCAALVGYSRAVYGGNSNLIITDCFSTADVFFTTQSAISDGLPTIISGYTGSSQIYTVSNFYYAGTNTKGTALRMLPVLGTRNMSNVYYDQRVVGVPRDTDSQVLTVPTVSLPTGFTATNWETMQGCYPVISMSDAYAEAFAYLSATALTTQDEEYINYTNASPTPNTYSEIYSGFRLSVSIPTSVDGAAISIASSEYAIAEETVPYNASYDTNLLGNTTAKTSDFLWKVDNGNFAILRNIFGGSITTGTSGDVYSSVYYNNFRLPYITISYTNGGVSASRKIVIPLENETRASGQTIYVSTERQLRAIMGASSPATMGAKMTRFYGEGTTTGSYVNSDKIFLCSNVQLNPLVNFTPITSLGGRFFGNGNTISNLKISTVSNDIGLFSVIAGSSNLNSPAIVKDLTITTVGISGMNNVGGLAGRTSGAVEIRNCNVYAADTEANPAQTVSGQLYVGGLVGLVADDNYLSGYGIYDCGTGVIVEGDNFVGGLAGSLTIPTENSFARNNVVANISNTDNSYGAVGGLVGLLSSSLVNSFASGSVIVNSINNPAVTIGVGGLVGIANTDSTVSTVFASGNVNVESDSAISTNTSGSSFGIGGLIGVSINANLVEKCYASSLVAADLTDATVNSIHSGIGGLIGVASGLVNAYSSGSVTQYGSNLPIGAVIGKSVSALTTYTYLYYDSLKNVLEGITAIGAIDGVTGVIPDSSGQPRYIAGITTTEFFNEGAGRFDEITWTITDGAYPVLDSFFAAGVSNTIKYPAILSAVTVTYDERDTSAQNGDGITMSVKMPTEFVFEDDTFYLEWDIAEGGINSASVVEVGENTNVFVPIRTTNEAQTINFIVYIRDNQQYGERDFSLLCAEMLGTSDKPYLISTAADFMHVAMSYAEYNATDSSSLYKKWISPITSSGVNIQGKVHYKLMSDIDMNNTGHAIIDLTGVSYDGIVFAGFSIDGSDYAVRNFTSEQPFIANLTADSDIKDITFDEIALGNSTTPTTNIALINTNNSVVDGVIVRNSGGNKTVAGTNYVAGIAVTNNGTIRNSVADVTIGCSSYCGGLVADNAGTIERCASSVAIVMNSSPTLAYVGGAVGNNRGNITDSFSMGSITSMGRRNVGGFVGYNNGTINGAYASTNITAALAQYNGLFAGQKGATATISNAYATGSIDSTLATRSAFCGNVQAPTTIVDCYYDMFLAGPSVATIDAGYHVATTDELYTLSCFSATAQEKFTATLGDEETEMAYPQLTGLLNAITEDANDGISSLKFRVLEAYSQVSTAGIRTAYGQFMNTLAVSTGSTSAVNHLTPGFTWTSNNQNMRVENSNTTLRAVAEVTNATVTATKTITIDSLIGTTMTFSNPFIVSAGNQNPCFPDGNGSVEDPYQLTSVSDFSRLKDYGPVTDANYILMNDIDAGTSLQGVDLFKGTLNGNKKVIYNMSLTALSPTVKSSNKYGVFVEIDGGKVYDLGIVGANITTSATEATHDIGLLASKIVNGATLEGCYATGILTVVPSVNPLEPSTYANVGGLVGYVAVGSVIKNCASSGKILNESDTGDNTIGGIVGLADTAVVRDCMSTTFVYGKSVDNAGASITESIGGIVGEATNGSQIQDSVYAGMAVDSGLRDGISVSGDTKVGNIAGLLTVGSTATGSLFDAQTVAVADNNGDAMTTDQVILTTLEGWTSGAASDNYPLPFAAGTGTMYAQGASLTAMPITIMYKGVHGSIYSHNEIRVPTATSEGVTVTTAIPTDMIAGTAVQGYTVIVPDDDPTNNSTELSAIAAIGAGNTSCRYIEPKLVRIISINYDIVTDVSAIENTAVGVQIKNRYGAFNMSSDLFTTAASTTSPVIDDIAVPIANGGFYIGAKLPEGYKYSVKWKGDNENGTYGAETDATVIENEYGCFIDVSQWDDTDCVFVEISIESEGFNWGVSDIWDSIAIFS